MKLSGYRKWQMDFFEEAYKEGYVQGDPEYWRQDRASADEWNYMIKFVEERMKLKPGKELLIQYCKVSIGVNDIDGHCPKAADWLVNRNWSCDEHVSWFLFFDRLSVVLCKGDNPILKNRYPLVEITIT